MQTPAPTSGIPSRRLDNTFETFDLKRAPFMAPAMQQAKRVAAGEAWCAFLQGKSDVGKTHLAIAAMHAYHDGGLERSRFWTVPDFLEHIRRYCVREHWEPNVLLRDYMERDILLVLDDLGVENATDWAAEQLYRVINARRDNELPTIVTSNLSLADVGERIVSRLKTGLVVCRQGR